MCSNGQMIAGYSYFNWVHHMVTGIELPVMHYDVLEDLRLAQRFFEKVSCEEKVKKKNKTKTYRSL